MLNPRKGKVVTNGIVTQPPAPVLRRTPPRRKKTSVSVPYAGATSGENARAEATKILRRLGCEQIGFMDDFENREVLLAPLHSITRDLITSQAINWGNDAFARGAYSYATPKTREAQMALRKLDAGAVFFSGEALYAGQDVGTVEAALASGTETAQAILAAG